MILMSAATVFVLQVVSAEVMRAMPSLLSESNCGLKPYQHYVYKSALF